MIHDSALDCVGYTPLVRLSRCFPDPELEVLAKLEMLNPFGSMKDRPARFIVDEGLRSGHLCPGMRLVESTSGNLGVALAVTAKLRGLTFTAVVDPNTSPTNMRLLEILQGIGFAALAQSLYFHVSASAPRGQTGGAVGSANSFLLTGQAAGPLLAGPLVAVLPVPAVITLLAVACAGAAVLAAAVPARHHRRWSFDDATVELERISSPVRPRAEGRRVAGVGR